MYRNKIKRLFDFVVAFVAFILLFPIFAITLILIYFANRGDVFFFQARPGKNEEIFNVVKFKTMNDKKGPDGRLLPDSDRLTRVGAFVRKTSLDEIPQLLNVLKGDMSLVGPRPLLVEYLPLYSHTQKRRHDVKPGITGWAQVNGRNAISWDQKFMYDVWYVDNISLALDIKILFMTVLKVFKSEGISQDGQATMSKFKGDNNNVKIN